MHSSDTTSASRRIFGHNLPADLIDAILRITHIPLLSEGWFVAGIVWGFSVAAVTFVFFVSVFFSGMAHANPAAVRTTLNISILIGLIYGVAGLAVNRLYNLSRKKSPRGPSPELHRAVAWHRLISADLLLLLGLAALDCSPVNLRLSYNYPNPSSGGRYAHSLICSGMFITGRSCKIPKQAGHSSLNR